MLRDLVLALIGAIVIVAIGAALEIVPIGTEPIESPLRATATMAIALLIGISGGFSWLQNPNADGAFSWPVFLAAFTAAGVCTLEVLYCLENQIVSLYTSPIALSGPAAVGIILGATVRATK